MYTASMRHRTHLPAARLLTATAAVLVLGGCATKGDIRDLRTELRALAVRQDSVLSQLRRDTRSTQDTLRRTTDQLFDFRGDIAGQLRELGSTLTRIEALAGQNQRGIAQIRDQLANMRTAPAAPPAGGAQGPSTIGGADAQAGQLYQGGVSQYNRGNLRAARIAFQQVIDTYPNDRLAPDARFYLGNIQEQEGERERALATFLEIQTLFPTAQRVPEALYRAGMLQIELGRERDARATLERVVNTYPDSPVADLAREALDDIR